MTASAHFIGSATTRRHDAASGAEHEGRTRACARVTRPRVAEGIHGLHTDGHPQQGSTRNAPTGQVPPEQVFCAGADNGFADHVVRELVIFWRLPNGVRCVVIQPTPHTWQLRVLRGNDAPILSEEFSDAGALFMRAQALRAVFAARDIAS